MSAKDDPIESTEAREEQHAARQAAAWDAALAAAVAAAKVPAPPAPAAESGRPDGTAE